MLRQFSQETGGRAFFPNQVSDLAGVYGQISDELSSQYTVGYTSRTRSATAPGGASSSASTGRTSAARTKQGYFAPTTPH